MTDQPSIYLAGPVAALDDGGREWRDAIQESQPGIDWLNPLDQYNVSASEVEIVRDDAGEGEVTVRELVAHDRDLVTKADGVLVGWSDVRMTGTPMEVMLAHERDIPIIMWISEKVPSSELSPWWRYHVDGMTHIRALAVEKLRQAVNGGSG